MRRDRTIEDFEVDLEHVYEIVHEITKRLDDKIDECNSDPRFAHRILSKENIMDKGEKYLPITKTDNWANFNWPGYYSWSVLYEKGSGFSSGGWAIYYYPNPTKFFDFLEQDLPDLADKTKNEWLELNPHLDFSKDLYKIISRNMVVDNNYESVLQEAFATFERLADSRNE